MPERTYTSDLWLGSLLLSETNAELVDLQVDKSGRKTVIFCFQGKELSKAAGAYHKGEALANVSEMRDKINYLRDLLFQSIHR